MLNIFNIDGFKRTIGSVLTFAGVYIVPNIPELAPFATGITALGAILSGVGVAHAGLKKLMK